MIWRVNLCLLLFLGYGSSDIDFKNTEVINYTTNESLTVLVRVMNAVDRVKRVEIKSSSTDDIIRSCPLDTGYQCHLNFSFNLIEQYNGFNVMICFKDKRNYQIQCINLLNLVYTNNRKENRHECLVHCSIIVDIAKVLHEPSNSESSKKFLEAETTAIEKSNKQPTKKPVIKIIPNESIYYYLPNTNLILTCDASDLPTRKGSGLALIKDSKNRRETIVQSKNNSYLTHNLHLKAEHNSSVVYCMNKNYNSKYLTFLMNDTYVGNPAVTTESTSQITKYIACAFPIMLCVVICVILLYYRKRASKRGSQDNDIYTYATSEQVTYAHLQLGTQEEKYEQLPDKTEKVPYATIIGVLKPN